MSDGAQGMGTKMYRIRSHNYKGCVIIALKLCGKRPFEKFPFTYMHLNKATIDQNSLKYMLQVNKTSTKIAHNWSRLSDW